MSLRTQVCFRAIDASSHALEAAREAVRMESRLDAVIVERTEATAHTASESARAWPRTGRGPEKARVLLGPMFAGDDHRHDARPARPIGCEPDGPLQRMLLIGPSIAEIYRRER